MLYTCVIILVTIFDIALSQDKSAVECALRILSKVHPDTESSEDMYKKVQLQCSLCTTSEYRELIGYRELILTGPSSSGDSKLTWDGSYTRGIYNSSAYKPGYVQMSNTHAAAECCKDGGHLVYIETIEEREALIPYMKNVWDLGGTTQIWTGAKRKGTYFYWPNSSNQQIGSDFWANDEPNSRKAMCARMRARNNYKMADHYCSKLYNYLCEKD